MKRSWTKIKALKPEIAIEFIFIYIILVSNDDSLDWKDPTPKQISDRVLQRVKPGSIVLFHNGAKNTPAALPTVLQTLQTQGYSIVPVSQLIYKDNYTIDAAGVQVPNSTATGNRPASQTS